MNKLQEFRALGLSEYILGAISKKGFETPSDIQSLTIPHLLDTDKDIIAQAQTGTGKTAAFGLPIIQLLTPKGGAPQAIILVPTRELALQVTEELLSFNANNLSIAPIYGGAQMREQLRQLKRGVDIVVGTPGRLLDHIRRKTLDLSNISYFVLDEADEMLNMGFIDDIEEIMREATSPKRVMLFSATMPPRIAALAKRYMTDPDILKAKSKNITTDLTSQVYYEVAERDKFGALTCVIDASPGFYGIVFSRTRVGVDQICNRLVEQGYAAEGLHGDISQAQREKIFNRFRNKQANILVATDVAARGIDIDNLTHVVNYSLPQDSESYIHRIGRTGRAGSEGTAITFVSSSERRKFGTLQRIIKADVERKQLPTAAEIVAIKYNRIKEGLESIIKSENHLDYTKMASELLADHAPEVAIGALLRLGFKDELSQKSYPQGESKSANTNRKGRNRIFLTIGRRDGYDARRIVELIKREGGLSDNDIDDIKVMKNFSFATIPSNISHDVIYALNLLSSDRPIAEIANEDRAHSQRGGGGGGESQSRGGGSSRRNSRRNSRNSRNSRSNGGWSAGGRSNRGGRGQSNSSKEGNRRGNSSRRRSRRR